jgi:adenine/guanine/hypoxanthine permease
VLMIGGFLAPFIRRITPRAALLGSLAGISLTFISLSPGAQLFMTPIIGVTCLAVILASWFGGFRYPGGIPGGLMAIMVGTLIAWGGQALGFELGGVGPEKVTGALADFGFNVPMPAFHEIFSGFKYIGVILVTAIPFGIYDLVEAMDNVESAEAAGDHFPTTRVLTADGVISLIGCLMGNPFINAVYIGHPGWKAMGGRTGYSAATGTLMLFLTWTGVIGLMMAIIPAVALLPILLYIGMLIGAQAFQESPHKHAPAVVLAIVPTIAAWGVTQINNALNAAGTDAGKVGLDALANNGVLYHGLQILGSGATLCGIILGSIAVMIIDKKLDKAAYFALAGAVLTFFGLIHAEAIGVGQTPAVAAAYLIVAVFLYACSKKADLASEPDEVMPSEAVAQPA